jgi:hypothetical protein
MKLVAIEIPEILASATYVDYRKYASSYICEPEDEFKNAEGYKFRWGVIREEYLDCSKFEGYEPGDGYFFWHFYPTEVYEASLANRKKAHPYEVMDVAEYLVVSILESLPDQIIFICDNDATDVICLGCGIKDYEIAKASLQKDIIPRLPDLWREVATWARNSIETPSMAFFRRGERKSGPFH